MNMDYSIGERYRYNGKVWTITDILYSRGAQGMPETNLLLYCGLNGNRCKVTLRTGLFR